MNSEIVQHLQARGFHCHVCTTAAQAKQTVLDLIGDRSVGIGGSKSVKQLGIADTLLQQGNPVYWHWLAEPSKKLEVERAALHAQVYLCSANAITEDGRIVQIDGTGNRVAAMLFGPPHLILLVGKNKLSGSLDDAIARIKREACPENARRLGLSTPCALTNVCRDCRPPARMCNATVVLEYPCRTHAQIDIVLLDEPLGL